MAGMFESHDRDRFELVAFDKFTNVQRVLAAFVDRPAVARGLNIPQRG